MGRTVITLPVRTPRRQPDPTYPQAETHRCLVNVLDLSQDIPLDEDTNPRDQNTDLAVYKGVARSLLNQGALRNSFHIQNKGITIVAADVRHIKDGELLELTFTEPHHGIVDGGHTAKIIRENQDAIRNNTNGPIEQFVKVDILVGYPDEILPDVIEALNSSMQVQTFSLLEFTGKFDWMKADLDKAGFGDLVSFRQNENADATVSELLMLLESLNTEVYPAKNGDYPVRSYSSKQAIVNAFAKNPEKYVWMSPILADVLTLFDTIRSEGREKFLAQRGRRGASTERFVETRKRGTFTFPFIGATGEHSLHRGAAVPILSAFRIFVEKDRKSGEARWRGGFDHVLEVWDKLGGDLVAEVSAALSGRDINSVAKDRNFWAALHRLLDSRERDLLQERAGK